MAHQLTLFRSVNPACHRSGRGLRGASRPSLLPTWLRQAPFMLLTLAFLALAWLA